MKSVASLFFPSDATLFINEALNVLRLGFNCKTLVHMIVIQYLEGMPTTRPLDTDSVSITDPIPGLKKSFLSAKIGLVHIKKSV